MMLFDCKDKSSLAANAWSRFGATTVSAGESVFCTAKILFYLIERHKVSVI